MSENHCYHKLKELKVKINLLNNQINETIDSIKMKHKVSEKKSPDLNYLKNFLNNKSDKISNKTNLKKH